MNTPDLPHQQAEPDTRPEVRIGDREREQAVTHLGKAFGEGRLELAEYDERVASAYSARTASDLLHLTTDLPLASTNHKPSDDHDLPEGVLQALGRRGTALPVEPSWMWRHWGTYVSVVALCLMIWLIVGLIGKGGFGYPWPLWVAGPWGALLLFQTIGGAAERRGPGDVSR